jgi:hypothetical protein
MLQESAVKTLEEMDFLFSKDRSMWVFMDNEATKVGALFDRDMAHGEALTAFDGKARVILADEEEYIPTTTTVASRERNV